VNVKRLIYLPEGPRPPTTQWAEVASLGAGYASCVAALAYLLLPLSGLIAFATGGDERVRFHGAQSIVFGTLWATALYAGSALSGEATLVVAVLGALVWVTLLVGTGLGRDPSFPIVGSLLWRAARRET
jgi:uncharacterized membrane protein